MKYKWLLFDADNTLFDFTLSQRKSLEYCFKAYNLEYSDEIFDIFHDINAVIWKDFDNNLISHEEIKFERFNRLFKKLNIGIDDLQSFNNLFIDNLISNSQLFDRTVEVLTHLHGKTKFAIITNGMKEVQRPRFDKCKYKHFFDSIFISGEIESLSKPNYSYFDYVYKNTGGESKTDYLVIGDNPEADIKGGKEYGFDTCWLRNCSI
ncbi:MAG: YjjG family noncanonical pyrimidine nucleotidase [Saprospiraceae bacterium]